MSWKQPIPTDINDNPNLDFLTRSIFCEIMMKCRNTDETISFWHGNKRFNVPLKRGQMILKVKDIADSLKISRNCIANRIKTLTETYTELDTEGKPFGLIVTVKDYDNLTNIEDKKTPKESVKGQSKDNERTPSNKHDKHEKLEKPDNNPVAEVVISSFKSKKGFTPSGKDSQEQAAKLGQLISSTLKENGIEQQSHHIPNAIGLLINQVEKLDPFKDGVKSLTPLLQNLSPFLGKVVKEYKDIPSKLIEYRDYIYANDEIDFAEGKITEADLAQKYKPYQIAQIKYGVEERKKRATETAMRPSNTPTYKTLCVYDADRIAKGGQAVADELIADGYDPDKVKELLEWKNEPNFIEDVI